MVKFTYNHSSVFTMVAQHLDCNFKAVNNLACSVALRNIVLPNISRQLYQHKIRLLDWPHQSRLLIANLLRSTDS